MDSHNQDKINSFFQNIFPICNIIPKNDNPLLANQCNNLFAVSSKYQAFYFDSLGEIIITEISRSDSQIRFSCKGLKCFIFMDDDHIIGFFDSNLFIFDVSMEEFQIKKDDSLSISKISPFPSNDSENIGNSLLVLDDSSSKLMGLEFVDENSYNIFDLFTNVIDFSTTSSHVFVLYEKEAKLYEIINYQTNEILSISINIPFPSHVQCTSTSYLIYFPNGYCIYDESGFKLHKNVKEGKYIYSTNCASVQAPDKVIVYCDEGKQEIDSDNIKCVTILNNQFRTSTSR